MSNCSAAQNQASACCTSASQTDAIETAEGTFGTLLRQLEAACGRDLVFVYDGHPTKPGYHVTEIKFARVTGLDCGANAESWSEVILQLWDIEDSVTGERMTVDKLLGIARKVLATIGAEESARLVFEVSDGSDAMRIFGLDRLEISNGVAAVFLAPRASACKPLVRGTLQPAATKSCGTQPAASDVETRTRCCGS